MSRTLVPRMLASSSLVSATTSVRVGARSAELLARRTPGLIRLAAAATAGGDGAGRAQAVFRDELIGLYRDAAELSWREVRRAMDDLDRLTHGGDRGPSQRRHRVKP
jgi:hypothetical protein